MTWAPGPVVTRRRLGGELKRLRLGAGWTLDAVADRLRCSTSKLSRLENGKGIPKRRDVEDLLAVYEVPDGELRTRLLAWSETGQRPMWWAGYADVLPQGMAAYLELEWDAQYVRSYEAHIPHGLLQTRRYAAAVLATAWRGLLDGPQIERLVDVRMRRQQALTDDHGLTLCCVLDESALYRVVGSPEVHREQLRHLMTVADTDRVELRILPFASGLVVPASQGAFAKLDFGDHLRGGIVYVERPTGESDFFVDRAEVTMYEHRLVGLLEASLPEDRSKLLLARAHHRSAL